MNGLKVGFARVGIDPPMGCGLAGYFVARYADGRLDPLEISVLAISDGAKTVILASSDTVNVPSCIERELRASVANATGVEADAVFFSATHTHTGPYLDPNGEGAPADLPESITEQYGKYYISQACDAASRAVADMKYMTADYGEAHATGLSYVRTYLMKNGSVRTNPGFNNPDVVSPVGETDDRVDVLRFTGDDGGSFVLVNYANHADTVGGTKTSADWCGFMRRIYEAENPHSKCLFFNGAEGDINHINVFPDEEYLSRVRMDFDDVPRGYAYTEYMGRRMAQTVCEALTNAQPISADRIDYAKKTVFVPTNMPKPEETPKAHRINSLHAAGRDDELPYDGMMLTTVIAEAERMVKLEAGPKFIPMTLSIVRIGDVAFLGIPGEPFCKIGIELKKAAGENGLRAVFPCSLTNGDIGYFPMKDAYENGGYEARSSLFRAGVGELIISEGKALVCEIKQEGSQVASLV